MYKQLLHAIKSYEAFILIVQRSAVWQEKSCCLSAVRRINRLYHPVNIWTWQLNPLGLSSFQLTTCLAALVTWQ